MHGVRQWWVRLSILHKAIVLSCAFVIPILLVVGLLMNDFYDYREKSDDILSEYARCTDYMNAMEQENALLGELTFAAPESDTIDKYADAVQDTAAAWERLRSAETDGSTQSEVLKQVIDRTMKSYRVRQETFIAQLHDGTFDAVNYEALRTHGQLSDAIHRSADGSVSDGGTRGLSGPRSAGYLAEHGIYYRSRDRQRAVCRRDAVLRTQPAAAGAADEPRCTPRRGWRIRH